MGGVKGGKGSCNWLPKPTLISSMKHTLPALLALIPILCVSCASQPVPSLNQAYNGKPVKTRASHPSGGSMAAVDGVYLGRRYYHPPASKTGLAYIDVYGQR